MIRRPPRSTRTDTLFPYTTLFRSEGVIDFANNARPDRLGDLRQQGLSAERAVLDCGLDHAIPATLPVRQNCLDVVGVPLVEDLHGGIQTLHLVVTGAELPNVLRISLPANWLEQIGRASCRERVCRTV